MFKRLLVPIDGSKLSQLAVPYAAHLAATLGSEIVLLYVLPKPHEAQDGPKVPDPEQRKELEQIGQRALNEALRLIGVPAHQVLQAALNDDVSGTILDVTEEKGADLIVISSHGLGCTTPGRGMMGSTAERVMARAKTPVLLVRDNAAIDALNHPQSPSESGANSLSLT
jgi:nucleotide-binding universal stress UspA family protein